MSSLKLSPTEAREAFDHLVAGLARQHTRTKFRNYFGKGAAVLDAKVFARGTILAEKEKPISNLLQEQPESVRATLFTGAESSFEAVSRTEPSSLKLGELLSDDDVEQGLIIRGRRAELFAYVDPGTNSVYVHRVVTEREPKPGTPPTPKKRSRTARARVVRDARVK